MCYLGGHKPFVLNKAGYTATQVACWWAGAIFEATPSFGQEQWAQRLQTKLVWIYNLILILNEVRLTETYLVDWAQNLIKSWFSLEYGWLELNGWLCRKKFESGIKSWFPMEYAWLSANCWLGSKYDQISIPILV